MELPYPEKYNKVVEFFFHEFGDIEKTTKLDDKNKLLLYALRQQAEHGPCTGVAPSIWYVRERAMYDAWRQLSGMTKFEAMVNFVKLLEDILGGNVNWVEKLGALDNVANDPVNSGGEDAGANDMVREPAGFDSIQLDDDLQLRLDPSIENVRFLALEVMRLREEVRRLQRRQATNQVARALAVCSTRTALQITRPQPTCLPPTATTDAHGERGMSWAEWLGLS
ncbi:putative Acyl CoA binding protein [Trypanosoma vivax]|uniref:ACB domain-containing protein n=1 Tax=Trypanosoma vivax (strain Y486) TaxID=1055687 RepID=G0UAP4_TRYVY|nr:hypothetical protein TRVL_00505 [Trypanosoma vivax]KAH8611567.1 putative Acyl CoA binding protein [Trypanosoma vivax]CCC52879.1 conserved hypothetical protein [Trypanosoma vivax Y486]